jgi:hypothetical protein
LRIKETVNEEEKKFPKTERKAVPEKLATKRSLRKTHFSDELTLQKLFGKTQTPLAPLTLTPWEA